MLKCATLSFYNETELGISEQSIYENKVMWLFKNTSGGVAAQYLAYDAFDTGQREALIIWFDDPLEKVIAQYFKHHTHIWRQAWSRTKNKIYSIPDKLYWPFNKAKRTSSKTDWF